MLQMYACENNFACSDGNAIWLNVVFTFTDMLDLSQIMFLQIVYLADRELKCTKFRLPTSYSVYIFGM